MKALNKIKILDITTIKIIAIIVMLMDHISISLLNEQIIFIKLGEIAFPLFAFCAAEGFYYTKNRKKYLCNLFIFAFISELFFDFALFGKIYWLHQNVLFTIGLAILFLTLYEYIKDNKKLTYDIKLSLILLFLSIFLVLSFIMFTDHTLYGVVLIISYYLLRDKPILKFSFAAILLYIVSTYKFALISIPILLLYNGKRGYNLKYFFYAFYPVHLLILAIIRLLIK